MLAPAFEQNRDMLLVAIVTEQEKGKINEDLSVSCKKIKVN